LGVLERGQAGHSPAMLCDDNLPLFLYVVQECGEILTRFAYAGSSHGRIVPHVALIAWWVAAGSHAKSLSWDASAVFVGLRVRPTQQFGSVAVNPNGYRCQERERHFIAVTFKFRFSLPYEEWTIVTVN